MFDVRCTEKCTMYGKMYDVRKNVRCTEKCTMFDVRCTEILNYRAFPYIVHQTSYVVQPFLLDLIELTTMLNISLPSCQIGAIAWRKDGSKSTLISSQ
jgi:hypothetical protein